MVRRFYKKNATVRCALAVTMAAVLTATGLSFPVNVYADESEQEGALSWQEDVTGTLDEVLTALGSQNADNEAAADLDKSDSDSELAVTVKGVTVTQVGEDYIKLEWQPFETKGTLNGYNVYFADKDTQTQTFLKLTSDSKRTEDDSVITVDADTTSFIVKRSTHKNWYFKVAAVVDGEAGTKSETVKSPTAKEFNAYLENLDRGLVKVATTEGVFLSWRLLGTEVTGYGETGLTGADFNVYKDGVKVAAVTDSTNYVVAGGSVDSAYTVVPVIDGTEKADAVSAPAILMSTTEGAGYLDIALQKPADTTVEEVYGVKTEDIKLLKSERTDTYRTTNITYSANDVSVGDVDGDGQYEFFVKWDPSLSKDVSQQGYTGKQYIDCYKLDGTLLYRIDLGINIRAGAHYTQFVVYDFNEDGKAEISLKTAPGTKVITFKNNDQNQIDTETYITTPDGESNDVNYVFSAADYRDYLIDVFMDWGVWANDSEDMKVAKAGWDKNLINLFAPEDGMVTKVTEADGVYTETKMTREEAGYSDSDILVNVPVKDADGNIVYKGNGAANAYMETVKFDDAKTGLTSSMYHDGGYTKEEATALADYFLNGYQYRMKKHNLNVFEGFIITGSEYLSLFEGATGKELDTIEYQFKREDDGMLWGDYAMNYIEPGNRCDRFLSTVAYLDGENPYLVVGRGYYTRATIATYTVTAEGKYKLNWTIDSGWTVMSNPFNDSPHGMDGNNTAVGTNGISFSKFSGQGDHYVEAADVDSDGKQEIVWGGAIVDDNGDLYSSGGDYLPDGTTWAKYGHGDAIHVADIDPDRPGLEIFSCFEGGTAAPYGTALRDAETNTTIPGAFSVYTGKDTGRCMIGDILPDVRGLETWGRNPSDAKGNPISINSKILGTNQSIRWSADMTTQIYTGNIVKIVDGTSQQTVLDASGTSSNNGSKGNAGLIADVFGDWREELVVRTTDSSALRIYTNTEVTDHKMYTLMHDTQYRAGVAGQNTVYNQPAYLSSYFASDTDWEYVAIPNAKKQQEPDKEHEHVFDTKWTTSETEHWHACTAEGCDGEVADRAAHTASEWKIKKEATTSEEGLRYTECTVCGRVLQTEKIAKLHAHVFDKAWTSDADAHWHVCTADGCDGKVDGKAAHTASDWIIDKVATATAEGLKHKECTVCGYRLVEETIAKAEAEHKHTFSDTWSTSAAEHWHACTADGCDGTVADKAAHTVSDWKVVKEATTQEAGVRQKECTVCGYVVETQSIPKLSEKVNGFDEDGGVTYWYENGVRQGYNPDDADYRGKEIYDSESDAWYWLDAVQEGAITKSKDVYQDSLSGDWGDATNDNGEKIGKWVRYDADGHMVKGWDENANGTYYFDPVFGTMAKGDVTIDGKNYTFDVITGILVSDENGKSIYEDGFHTINGVDYWYEGGVRQGFDAVDDYFRGKEIYDPASDAWFWLDNIQNGAVAKSKDVYQESLAGQWGDSVNADGEKIGKWVRYDENGHMVKGWNEKDGNTYYFDPIFGTMAKGEAVIDGQTYYFDTITGIRK